jgi:hypothetical protein
MEEQISRFAGSDEGGGQAGTPPNLEFSTNRKPYFIVFYVPNAKSAAYEDPESLNQRLACSRPLAQSRVPEKARRNRPGVATSFQRRRVAVATDQRGT